MDPVYREQVNAADLERISNELFQEIRSNRVCRLSNSLRSRINILPRDVRKALVDGEQGGCTPLFVACREGKLGIVDYLIQECDANIEKRGVLRDQTNITPLFCACHFGHLEIVITLVRMGCQVNALSDNCSTALRIAIIKANIVMVQYLIENGADIRKPCSYGITYLSDSIKSHRLCKYLISKGADVNEHNSYDKTALHYAVQSGNLKTVQLLLNHGANPYAKTDSGDDALQLACIVGFSSIANCLMERIPYSPERLADAYRLIGSSLILNFSNMQLARPYWQMVCDSPLTRHDTVQRRFPMDPRVAYGNAVEFTHTTELEEIISNSEAMQEQSLMIHERILGIAHDATLKHLVERGYFYFWRRRFQTCLDLWILILKVRIEKQTILRAKTNQTVLVIVQMMLKFLDGNDPLMPRFEDVHTTFQLLSSNISETQQLLTIQPVFEKQLQNYDRILQLLCYLIYILIRVAKTENERLLVESSVRDLVRNNIRSLLSKTTLLHLSVSRIDMAGESLIGYTMNAIFPSKDVARLLLECGADVNACDEMKSTPLLLVSYPEKYNKEIVSTLVDFGAHLDMTNIVGDRPSTFLLANPENDIPVQNYISLQCLTSNAIASYNIPYRNNVPPMLEAIVDAHSQT